jgi:hypothetical protein
MRFVASCESYLRYAKCVRLMSLAAKG